MHQITREGEYAFRAVLYLASRPVGQLSRVSEVAQAAEIPSSYLSKIMRRLCAAGLVKSRRGPKGGFVLARPAEGITLREAIEAVEGPVSSNPRLAKGGLGQGSGFALHPVWGEAQRSFLDVLGGKTIAEISRDGEAIRDRARLKKGGP